MKPQRVISHAVTLDITKCKGCTTCIRHCPTEAIRVRSGKAKILPEKCIDCGQCILVCPHHAKQAVVDRFEECRDRYEYRIALPAPTLYGQFNNLDDIDYILNGLLKIGFDDVFEVARAAEIISDYTRRLLKDQKLTAPVISSACPAVVRLIRVRFPQLCSHVLPVLSPVHLAATMAREEAMKKTGLPSEKIGIFFISPCPAKVTDVKEPIGLAKSDVDHVLAMKDVYMPLVKEMKHLDVLRPIAQSGVLGIGWATSGGESAALLKEKYLAADGIDNVIKILEELEDDKLTNTTFIELNACTGGCVGGAFTVENPFVTKARIQRVRKYLPFSHNWMNDDFRFEGRLDWEDTLQYSSVLKLAPEIADAMEKISRIEQLTQEFPGLDCGACGAPTCRTLAEDVVCGRAKRTDCLFVLKRELGQLLLQDHIHAAAEEETEHDDP